MATLLEQIRELVTLFTDVATTDPISAVLVLIGTVLMAFSIGFFGLLTAGALVGGATR